MSSLPQKQNYDADDKLRKRSLVKLRELAASHQSIASCDVECSTNMNARCDDVNKSCSDTDEDDSAVLPSASKGVELIAPQSTLRRNEIWTPSQQIIKHQPSVLLRRSKSFSSSRNKFDKDVEMRAKKRVTFNDQQGDQDCVAAQNINHHRTESMRSMKDLSLLKIVSIVSNATASAAATMSKGGTPIKCSRTSGDGRYFRTRKHLIQENIALPQEEEDKAIFSAKHQQINVENIDPQLQTNTAFTRKSNGDSCNSSDVDDDDDPVTSTTSRGVEVVAPHSSNCLTESAPPLQQRQLLHHSLITIPGLRRIELPTLSFKKKACNAAGGLGHQVEESIPLRRTGELSLQHGVTQHESEKQCMTTVVDDNNFIDGYDDGNTICGLVKFASIGRDTSNESPKGVDELRHVYNLSDDQCLHSHHRRSSTYSRLIQMKNTPLSMISDEVCTASSASVGSSVSATLNYVMIPVHKDNTSSSSIDSMSAVYSRDKDKMLDRRMLITTESVPIPDDADSAAAESAMTANTDPIDIHKLTSWTFAIRDRPSMATARDCNYGNDLESVYEKFGIEQQLDLNLNIGCIGDVLGNNKSPHLPRSKPVDVDDVSTSHTSLATEDSRRRSQGVSETLVRFDDLDFDWLCGDVNGEGKRIHHAEAVLERIFDDVGNEISDLIPFLDGAMHAIRECRDDNHDCHTEFDCWTEFDGSTECGGNTVDGNTVKENGGAKEAFAKTNAIRMQSVVFVAPNVKKNSMIKILGQRLQE
ncbi:hypothetical protein ACHAWU_009703 [Discostella pseudostelligera]|uniref:Uncharacterized protein n=1 Tax=Discostella pseudostelligera TaxID=259834 RepID=A0ABD3MZ45_9STRA